MLSIFAKTLSTATRHDPYSSVALHQRRGRPLTTWEAERIEAERRRAAMRNVGMW